jgi:hypothetical protein
MEVGKPCRRATSLKEWETKAFSDAVLRRLLRRDPRCLLQRHERLRRSTEQLYSSQVRVFLSQGREG